MCSSGLGLVDLEAGSVGDDALALLAGLLEASDEAGDEAVHALTDAELLAATSVLVGLGNRVEAALTQVVRVADTRQAAEHDGLKTMSSWLRGHARLSGAAAGRLVRNGRALAQLPALAAAFAAGAASAEQVSVAAKVATPARLAQAAAQGIDLTAVDRVLAGVAAARPFLQLGQVVTHYLTRLDPDGPEPDPTGQRSLRITRHADGSVSGWFDLDALGAAKVTTALEATVQAGRCAGDERSRAQQQADALVQLADLALATGALPQLRTRKPHIGAVVPYADLTDPTTGPGTAHLDSGAVISAARARWIACDSTVVRIVMSPDGVPIEHGRAKRVVDTALRRVLDLRDQGCVFTGCTAPTWWCEAHHLLAWALGGETTPDNLALLCERHHTKIHHGFRIQRQPDGQWHTWRPDGTQILLGPDHSPPLRTVV